MQDFSKYILLTYLLKIFPGKYFFHCSCFTWNIRFFFIFIFFSNLFYFSKYIFLTYLFIQIISREIFFHRFCFTWNILLFFIYIFIRTYFISLNIYYLLTYLSNYFPGNIFSTVFVSRETFDSFLYLYFYSDLLYFSKYILSTYLFIQIISREIFFPPFLFHVKHSTIFYIYIFFGLILFF